MKNATLPVLGAKSRAGALSHATARRASGSLSAWIEPVPHHL